MKVVYENGKDIGAPYWRLSIECRNSIITVKMENFTLGFRESIWDKVFSIKRQYDLYAYYDEYVSMVTKKGKSFLESHRDELINEFYEILKYNEEQYKKEIHHCEKGISDVKDKLSAEIFKKINRDEILKEIGI